MVCEKCGNELDDGWVTCPYCQTNIEQNQIKEATDEFVEKNVKEWGEGVAFLLSLYKKHPIRFLMCVPIWVYAIYLVFTMDIGSTLVVVGFAEGFGEILGYMLFASVSSWCLYGPINSRQVRELIKKSRGYIQKKSIKENIESLDEDERVLELLFQEHPIRFLMCALVYVYMIYVWFSMGIDELFSLSGVVQILRCTLFTIPCAWCLYGPVNLEEVRCIAGKKATKNLSIPYMILYSILAILLISCTTEGNNYSGADVYSTEYTIDEYLSKCIVVDLESLARNPEEYVGKDIIVEGSLGTTFGVLHVGMWTTTNPVVVEYDGVAYDTDFNEVGNILDGDYGYVAGRFMDDETIDGFVVIVE